MLKSKSCVSINVHFIFVQVFACQMQKTCKHLHKNTHCPLHQGFLVRVDLLYHSPCPDHSQPPPKIEHLWQRHVPHIILKYIIHWWHHNNIQIHNNVMWDLELRPLKSILVWGEVKDLGVGSCLGFGHCCHSWGQYSWGCYFTQALVWSWFGKCMFAGCNGSVHI